MKLSFILTTVGFILVMPGTHDKLDDNWICATLAKIDSFWSSLKYGCADMVLTTDGEFHI
jgi:hypothetical protein